MTYFELIELYKKKELDEEISKKIEIDIEKHEAISEYLFEKEEIAPDNEEDILKEDDGEFLEKINRYVRKAFLRLGITVGGITIAVVLFTIFVLPHIVSVFYYNPGEIVAENTNRMSLDMAVYTELMIPEYFREDGMVEDNGYGSYDITIVQNASYTNWFTNVSGTVKRNKLKLYDINALNKPSGNAFGATSLIKEADDILSEEDDLYGGTLIAGAAGGPEQAKETLINLEEDKKYIGYVTLDRLIRYDEFIDFINRQKNIYSVWCTPCTSDFSDGGSFNTMNMGFYLNPGHSTFLNWDREKYPNLMLWQSGMNEKEYDNMTENIKSEDFMKTHFISLLNYMSDQEMFLEMVGEDSRIFEEAADYIDKNGITVYGFACIAEKEDLIVLNEREEVYEIYTQPLR